MGDNFFKQISTPLFTCVVFLVLGVIFGLYGSFLIKCVLSIIMIQYLYRSSRLYVHEKIHTIGKAALITGCDTGFGHHLAKRLDSRGFQVFAGCLFPEGEGANELKQTCSNRLLVLPLDISNDECVAKALTFIKDNLGSNVLWSVVNNAGILKGFSVDFTTIQQFRECLDVNTLGAVRVTKTFLPLLKKSKGRIINMCSYASRMPTMDLCAYTMSKYAILAFTECLSIEMIPFGIRVIAIEPEAFRTGMSDRNAFFKRFDEEMKNVDEEILSTYGKDYLKNMKKWLKGFGDPTCANIDIVVDAIESAMCDKFPDQVYKPSRNLFVLGVRRIIEILPRGITEMMLLLFQKISGYPSPEKRTEVYQ